MKLRPPARRPDSLRFRLSVLSRLFFGAMGIAAAVRAQQVPPVPPPGAPPPPDNAEVVELSPFMVQTSRDVGYQAENTLAGSRLNAKLRDTPGSVSVFTKEFIEDLGITDLKDLVEYSVSSEMNTESRVPGTGQNAFINAQNLNNNVLTRGIAASQGMDYFTSIAPIDSYRVGRYDDSRGPNSILFGIGSVGGIINQSSKVATVLRDGVTLRYATGSWDRHRSELDVNKVLRKDTLAVALSGLHQENGGWRNFDFQDKKRLFAAITYRPIRRLTFQAMGETGHDTFAIMRSGGESEEVLAWYDNREARGVNAVTAAPAGALPNAELIALGITGRNGATGGQNHRVTFIENTGVLFDAIGTYLSGTYNNAAVRAPDGTPGRTGATLRIDDPRIFPRSMNAAGPGMHRAQSLANYTLTADWQAAKNLFFNFGHNFQKTYAELNLMVGASPILRGEPNRTLGVGGPPNPFAGRLYFDGDWRRDYHKRDYRESRLSASYTLEAKWRWLGRHRFVGLVAQSEDYDERANSWLVLAGRPYNADAQNANNRVTVRNYLTEGSYTTYRVGDWRTLPSSLNFGGRTFATTYANDAAGSGTNGGATQETRARLGVVQSQFWRERLITTVGYREDRAKIFELGYSDDPVRGPTVDPDPAKRKRYDFTGKTHTAGVVLHVRDWVSLIANRSTNVGVPSFNRTVFPDGNLATPTKGKGADYGLGLDLLGGRINAKFAYFESSEDGATGAYGATGSFTNRNRRILDAFAPVLVGAGLPFSQSQWDALRTTYAPGVSGALADFNSSGYEARITANPRSNWRIVANYAYNDSARAELYQDAIPWYGFKPAGGNQVKQGVTQNAAGQFVVDASAFESGRTVAKWIELGAMRPGASLSTLTTSAGVTVAQEIYNLIDEMNSDKLDFEKRWGLRPHRVSLFTAYDFKEGWPRGVTLGGGWRWRSANVIGADANGREITGRAITAADLMARYARKFRGLPGRVSFQLNVSNFLGNDEIIPVRLMTADAYVVPGRKVAYGRYDYVPPREIRFTTTYSY